MSTIRSLVKHPIFWGVIFGVTVCVALLILFPQLEKDRTLVKMGDFPQIPTSVDHKTEHASYHIMTNDQSVPSLAVEVWAQIGANGVLERQLVTDKEASTGALFSYRWTADSSKELFSYIVSAKHICQMTQTNDQFINIGNPFLLPVTSDRRFLPYFHKTKQQTINYLPDTVYDGKPVHRILLFQTPTDREILLVEPKTLLLHEDRIQRKASGSQDWQDASVSNLVTREFTDAKPASFYVPSPYPQAQTQNCND